MNPGKESEKDLRNEGGDYLWDGAGAPDPEVQKLEALLGKYRHAGPTPVFPAVVPSKRWTFLRWPRVRVAIAAATLLAIGVVGFVIYEKQHQLQPGESWNVSRLAGTPRIGRKVVGDNGGSLLVGQRLETDGQSRAQLKAEGVGQIEVDPDTRVRLVTMGALKRIALDRGTIHAFIWSPPGQFVVDTPSATTVDLGCAYTLQVDDSGAGTLRTTLGWVGFKFNGREAFIPTGAVCSTRPRVGPGTPYFEDTSAEFQTALTRFDFEDTNAEQRAEDLSIVLKRARKRDALTLWHLLSRVEPDQRGRVCDRLAEFAPPPQGVSKDGVLQLDQAMLDSWWNSLGFDDISVWRHWEHSWSGEAERNK
jgi:hypothetical protein